MGRFGPEYFVSEEDLSRAGLANEPVDRSLATRATRSRYPATANTLDAPDGVPFLLYEQLQMKHEQLLVQYGMVRAGGLQALELRAELELKTKQCGDAREELARVDNKLQRETARLRRELREAHLELEGRSLEIAALREKVRGLEMLTRNAVTTETIENQFREVIDQSRRVEELSSRGDADGTSQPTWTPPRRIEPRDH